MVEVGNKVKIYYISDCNPHNDKIGTVIEEGWYKYYPNGTPNEFLLKQRCTIQYPDGSKIFVQNTERKGSGVVSPLIIVEEEG